MLDTGNGLRLLAAGLSDVGRVRQNNEDAYLSDPDLGLFAIADGMGGHQGGEVAAQMAIDGLRAAFAAASECAYLSEPSVSNRQKVLTFLAKTIDDINDAIHTRGRASPELRGMGCTLDVVLIRDRGLFLAHVGDSRIYGLLGGTLYQFTEDHTYGQALLSSGALSAEEVSVHPNRSLLARALGIYPKVQTDTIYLDIAPDDSFLLCSDGVHGTVDKATLEQLLATKNPAQAARTIINAALAAGGPDNATAVVLRVESCQKEQSIRVGSHETLQAMARASLFAGFSENELRRVQKIAIGYIAEPGEVLVQAGELCSDVCLLIDGALSAWNDQDRVAVLGPSDPYGELSLYPAPALVTIRADARSRVLVFPLSEVASLLNSDSTLAAKLAMNALKRVWQRFLQLAQVSVRLRAAAAEAKK